MGVDAPGRTDGGRGGPARRRRRRPRCPAHVTEQPHGPGSRLVASDAAPIYLPQRPDLEDRPDATIGHTSLPERIGGDKNWDYRYMGGRNASYTVDAPLRPGLHNEVYAAVTHLIGCVRSTGPDLTVFC